MPDLKTILHVDDDADIRDIVQMALTMVDSFELHQRASGAAALEDVASLAPDLLLLDVMMPVMTGPEFWERVKTQPAFQSIPTIFMTAKAEDALSSELLDAGALAVITKPFDPMTLGQNIRDAWAKLP